MKKLVRGLLALIVPAFFASCSPSQLNSMILEGAEPQLAGIKLQNATPLITVTTLDDKPIAGAEILIGTSLNRPMAGNLLKTDKDGQATIPVSWIEPTHVTVFAEGYVPTTYLNQKPGSLEFKLRPVPPQKPIELRGQAGPLPIQDKDGWADFALVMPALTRMDMLSFDVTDVISKEMDKISAAGQVMPVPSNISIPKQQERYGILNVTFQKPVYRTYFEKAGRNRVYALQGKFPFKNTADALRGGKTYFDVLNSFVVTAGATRDVILRDLGAPLGMDMPTQDQLYDKARIAMGPPHARDEYYLGVSISEQSGFMVPTDFKRLQVGEKSALRVFVNSENLFLGVLKKKSDLDSGVDRMSAALVRFTNEASPAMLPLLPDPRISGDTVVLPRASAVSGIYALATYAVLSSESTVSRTGQEDYVNLRTVWEVYSHEWVSSFELPHWKENLIPRGAKRWEVNLIGSQNSSQAPTGPAMLETATHVTHSSASF